MSHLNQTFGVEIECYLPEGATQQAAAFAVSARLGRPDACRVETYNHLQRTWWKIVTDGSLGSAARGFEFVSPVLTGQAGLDQVAKVCEALTDFGCTVNKSCGFHVHVGVAGQPDLGFFRRLVKLYASYEPVIDAIMPVSRRGNGNTYCRSMVTVSLATLDRASALGTVITAANPSGRYAKLNLTAYRRHRTVEFRQHSGTTDATKAVRWTSLCLKMVDAAKRELSLGGVARSNRNAARPGTKSHQIGEMLLRAQGVTAREVLAATGWPSVSMPAQARACGLTLTKQRVGNEIHYFAVATEASAPAITVDGFAALIGASDDERRYMHDRTRNLAGPVAWAA